jgi:hypothetical protein
VTRIVDANLRRSVAKIAARYTLLHGHIFQQALYTAGTSLGGGGRAWE